MTSGLRPDTLLKGESMSEIKGTYNPGKNEKRSEKRKRELGLFIRLNKEEDAKLRAMAFAASLHRPGDLIRAWINGKEVKAVPKHPEGYYRNLHQIGNNINQISKKMNTGQIINKTELQKLIKICKEVLLANS